MLRLQQCVYFHTYPFLSTPFSLKTNQKTSILAIGWNCCKGLIKSRRRSSSLVVGAVEKESDFEVDPVKAREALRKLDEQLQSLAEKKIDPPKVRASDMTRTRDQMKEEIGYDTEISGTSLTYAVSGLLIFTILYNVLFLTVIKPSIDGPEPIEDNNFVIRAEKASPLEQFPSTQGTSVEP